MSVSSGSEQEDDADNLLLEEGEEDKQESNASEDGEDEQESDASEDGEAARELRWWRRRWRSSAH